MRLLTTPAERFERSIGRNLKRSEQTATPAKTSAASVSAAFALTDRVPADPNWPDPKRRMHPYKKGTAAPEIRP